jgi:thiol:disulfide interchange protein DsbD
VADVGSLAQPSKTLNIIHSNVHQTQNNVHRNRENMMKTTTALRVNIRQYLLIMLSFILGTFFAAGIGAAETQDQPNVAVSASVQIADVQAGNRQAKLIVTANIADGLHIYAQSQPKPFLATKISVAENDGYQVVGEFRPVRDPILIHHQSLQTELHEFEGEISWEVPIRIAAGVDLATLEVTGEVFAQACEEERCFAPETYQFVAQVYDVASFGATGGVTAGELAEATPLLDSNSGKAMVETGAFSLDQIEVAEESESSTSIWAILPLAFIAGFVLNFMPCVLPVVGLKVLSFVQQANNNRRRIFMLNLFYALGIISVLLVLATLAVFAGLGWGEQFSSVAFTVVLASVVFAFALSFLGVWEIQLPGFVNSIQGGSQSQEGLGGAFSKGVLSTVLATPCSGPFLGSALAWAVIQPAHLTFLVFGTVGLGMASPFLAIGFFPKLVNWLPKPGAWMKSFKQLMGFVLIATVVFLLSFIKIPALVPSIALMAAIGLACWWYGQHDFAQTGSGWKRLASSVAIVAVAGWLSFGILYKVSTERFERAATRYVTAQGGEVTQVSHMAQADDEIPWQPYSREQLESAIASGKTVFVDFTADWCLTCKSNEAVAINQPEVAELIRRKDIVAFRADKTEPAPEVDELLKQLGNNSASIPFYAVFPEDNPAKPITLDGIFSSPDAFITALEGTGSSG